MYRTFEMEEDMREAYETIYVEIDGSKHKLASLSQVKIAVMRC